MFTRHKTGAMLGWNEDKIVNPSSADLAHAMPNVTHVAICAVHIVLHVRFVWFTSCYVCAHCVTSAIYVVHIVLHVRFVRCTLCYTCGL